MAVIIKEINLIEANQSIYEIYGIVKSFIIDKLEVNSFSLNGKKRIKLQYNIESEETGNDLNKNYFDEKISDEIVFNFILTPEKLKFTCNVDVDFIKITYELENNENDGSESHPYNVEYKFTTTMLNGIFNMIENNRIRIPNYQRDYVWTKDRASWLIDSVLRGIPLPSVVLYETDRDASNKPIYDVVDGQQRLLSLFYFWKGYFPKEGITISLEDYKNALTNSDETGLKLEKYTLSKNRFVTKVWQGESIDNNDVKTMIEEYSLSLLLIAKMDSLNAILDLFERINLGSQTLSKNEVRMRLSSDLLREKIKNIMSHKGDILGINDTVIRGDLLRTFTLLNAISNGSYKLNRAIETSMDNFIGADNLDTIVVNYEPHIIKAIEIIKKAKAKMGYSVFHLTEKSTSKNIVLYDIIILLTIELLCSNKLDESIIIDKIISTYTDIIKNKKDWCTTSNPNTLVAINERLSYIKIKKETE